ncbi:permease of the major facilitator superfamily [Glonium stellatum]|uniref:Permease of the major facilitator superfamily n=1 Tax=Glonium stellatum TaxID=574774 RepID=A0A8E2JUG6_9PEZI|nr:permease of the major facilitator superfamily [Glonium stellatum]
MDQTDQNRNTQTANSSTRDLNEYPTGFALAMTLFSLALGTFLMALDTTIIAVAVPKISTQFNALGQVGWIGSSYLITLTTFQVIAGKTYKEFNPKTTYMVLVIVFEAGSIICATALSSVAFIVGRAIVGVGAAGLIQGALGIITYISTLEKRPFHLAIVISVFGITNSCGPMIGGVFTDRVSWRWCFWVNLPFGGLTLILVLLFLDVKTLGSSSARQHPIHVKLKRLDPVGFVLLISSVCCLFIALQEGGTSVPWKSARIIGLLIGFGLLGVLFWVSQWMMRDDALVPVRFFRQRTIVFGSLFLFCDNMSNYLKLYYLPFYFQAVLDTSAIRSGVNYMALAVPQFFALLLSGGLVSRFGYYMPAILFGQALCVVGTGFLTQINTTTSTAEWAGYMILVGFGLGMGINIPHIAIQAVMETDEDIFLANGIATLFSQLGGSIAISMGNALLINGLDASVPTYAPGVSAKAIIDAGPLNLSEFASSAAVLSNLRVAYGKAIQHVLIFALVIICTSVPVACGMQWLNLKSISKDQENAKAMQNNKVENEIEKST